MLRPPRTPRPLCTAGQPTCGARVIPMDPPISSGSRMKSLSVLLIPLLALSLSAFAQTAPQQSSNDPSSNDPSSTQPAGSDAMPAGSGDPSAAQPASYPRHGGGGDRFRAADTNGDGKLSRSEAQAMPWVAKHFDEIDTNHDGFITRDELRAARDRMRAMRAQRAGGQSGNSTPPSDSSDDGSN